MNFLTIPLRSLTYRALFTGFAFLFLMTGIPAAARYQEADLALSHPLTVKWRYASDQASNFTPATDEKTVFLPLAGGTLVALNLADGQLRWKAEAGGEFSAAPVVDEHVVYVATQYPGVEKNTIRGTLQALSKDTGITLWMRTLQSPVRGSLAAGPASLFAGAANGSVYAFDKSTGRTGWVNQYGDEFDAQPMLSGNRLYIGSLGGWLSALDQSNGNVVWRYRARGPIHGSIAITNSTVFFGSGDSYVYAVKERQGKLLWKRRTGAGVQAVAAVDSGLLASSLDNFAYFLSLKKGAVLWRQLLPGRIPARPVTATDGALFTPLSTDSAIVLNLKDGKPLNTLRIGEENTSSAAPVAAGNLVLLTTQHGLLAFSAP
jgi:outer membrane protein assembly factor BamB